MKKFFTNKYNIGILIGIISILVSLAITVLIVLALIKFIWG